LRDGRSAASAAPAVRVKKTVDRKNFFIIATPHPNPRNNLAESKDNQSNGNQYDQDSLTADVVIR
jgi:hypothetical protein